MTRIFDIVPVKLLNDMIEQGYVTDRTHPKFPELHILNYTPKAQFEHMWNEVTRQTRGLIYNDTTHEVLARPFAKIHNWDEPEAPAINWDAPVYSWSNKYDGSLGIFYKLPNAAYAIATRGSFASEQAIEGTRLLWEMGDNDPLVEQAIYMYHQGYTPLYEIIYPENRIVLDYGDERKLQPLGYVNDETGVYCADEPSDGRTFRELVTDLARPNSEGWVVWLSGHKAVKIKQPDYVELHRIVTGMNRKTIWQWLKDDGPLVTRERIAELPDELFEWATGVEQELLHQFHLRMLDLDIAWVELHEIAEDLGIDFTDQKEFALTVQKYAGKAIQGHMFALRSGKPIDEKIWKELEPVGGER